LFARGDSGPARAALTESVEGYRRHAQRDPDLLPRLAGLLTDLAYMRFQAGDSADAVEAADEALAIYQTLGEEYRLGLALAYNNRSNCLSDPDAALEAQSRAVEVIRPIAREHPAEAAMLLRNLAACLTDAGRMAEAARANAEAETLG
jgi:tetratricopeptide (TPR) repeat protein